MILLRSLCCLFATVLVLPAAEIRVTKSADGQDAKAINGAIQKLKKEGGGTLVMAAGEYLITEPISLAGAHQITLRGEPGAVLKLAPLAYGVVAEPLAAGDATLHLRNIQGFRVGQQVKLNAPGVLNSFTNKPAPYFIVKPTAIDGGALTLQKPAEFPAAVGTEVLWADDPNLIEISGDASDIVIEQLTLEGAATPDSPQIATHNTRCGVWITGNYSYEKGPLGPKPRAIVVRDCRIAGFHGRGVAIYSAENCLVERCRIEATLEEAIDFDHFVVDAVARNNELLNCRLGVEINDANDCTVEGNRIAGGAAGVRVWRWCKMPELNVRNRIAENLFDVGNKPAVELLEGTSDNLVEGNVVSVAPPTRVSDVMRDRGQRNRWERNVPPVEK